MDLPLFFTLPLIGGFAFATGFFLLRWRSARQDAQRLYYRAAVWGGVLSIVAAIVHGTLSWTWSLYAAGFEWLLSGFLQPLLTTKDTAPASLRIKSHVALVCVYALLLGICAPVMSAAVLRSARRLRMSWLVKLNFATITDPLESLLSSSLVNGEAIQVTLSTGKVYVGYVLEAPDPDLPTKFIKLQPLMSGQRGANGQVEYTTFYDKILMEFESNPTTKVAVESFQQVVPVDKVVTLSGFNLDAYVHFLAEHEERSDPSPQSAGSSIGNFASATPWLLLAGLVVSRLKR